MWEGCVFWLRNGIELENGREVQNMRRNERDEGENNVHVCQDERRRIGKFTLFGFMVGKRLVSTS